MSTRLHNVYYTIELKESCFFFQAEDGIRDLVRSRGLGDVYKRQVQCIQRRVALFADVVALSLPSQAWADICRVVDRPVSYTHLTLPTSDLV